MTAPTLVSGPRRPTPWGLIVALGVFALAVSFGAVLGGLELAKRRAAMDGATPSASIGAGGDLSANASSTGTASVGATIATATAPSVASAAGNIPAVASTATHGSAKGGRPTTTSSGMPLSGTPVPTVVSTPATVSSVPMGGRTVSSMGLSFEHCALEATHGSFADLFKPVRPAVNACFAAAELDPPVHELRDYEIQLDATGHVTQVALRKVVDNEPVPRLDACIGIALKGVVVPVKAPCAARVSYSASCAPNEYGKCGRPPR